MEKRNFYILVAAIMIGMTIFWLTLYNLVELGYTPEDLFGGTDNDTDADKDIVITIKGKVTEELKLSLEDLKSDKYTQVEDRTFHFINAYGTEFEGTYSGVSLWSILEEEGVLEEDASAFVFIGSDGYESENPLELSLAEDNPKDVILAYEENGQPIFEEGPVKSIIDREVIPDEVTTHYCVQNLKYVEIS